MLLGAVSIFGTIGIFRRYIPLSSGLLAFTRGITGALFLLFVRFRREKVRYGIRRRDAGLLIFSGAVMGFNWILLFEAYNYTTVAIATLCYYMQPTIVLLLSPLIFRESLTLKKLLCAGIAVLGMVFVSGVSRAGTGPEGNIKGILFGLGAAVFYAGVILLNKKIGKIDAYEKSIIQLLSASIVLIPYLFITEDIENLQFNVTTLLLVMTVGLVHTGIAYALYFGCMDGLRVQTIAVFSYIDPIVALVLSTLILHEPVTVLGIIGAILIIGAAVCMEAEAAK